jgi:hypothetical protein
MPRGTYERTPEVKAKISAGLKKRFANPDYKTKQSEHLKRLREDPEIDAKRREAKKAAHGKKSEVRKWMAATGCNYEQYWHAYVRWVKNKDDHNGTGFSMEQEIARAMDRPDGKVVAGHTRKVIREKIQQNGQVPVLAEDTPIRRKRRLPPAPVASAVPPPLEQCWTDFPDDTAWVDELD